MHLHNRVDMLKFCLKNMNILHVYPDPHYKLFRFQEVKQKLMIGLIIFLRKQIFFIWKLQK
jgi:hypothetical protein